MYVLFVSVFTYNSVMNIQFISPDVDFIRQVHFVESRRSQRGPLRIRE